MESRRWEELIAIQQEQLELLESLPDSPPREARRALENALERCRSTQQLLFGSMAETQGLMERLGAGRRAIGSYRTTRRGKVDAHA